MSSSSPGEPAFVGLPPSELATVFPFHLAVDGDLRVVQIGPSLRRLLPDLAPGVGLHQAFLLKQAEGVSAADIAACRNQLFVLVPRARDQLVLRGQVVPAAGGHLLWLVGHLLGWIGFMWGQLWLIWGWVGLVGVLL